MPISVKCSCGKALSLPDSFAGKKVKCPMCGQAIQAPAAAAASQAGAAAPGAAGAKVRVECECGAALSVSAAYVGKKIKCPRCSQPVLVGGGPAKAAGSALSGLEPNPEGDGRGEDDGRGYEIPKPKCKRCGHEMELAALVCVACGLNQSTGESVAGFDGVVKKEKGAGFSLPKDKLIIIVVAVAVVAGGAFAARHFLGKGRKPASAPPVPAAPAKPAEAKPPEAKPSDQPPKPAEPEANPAEAKAPVMEKVEAKPVMGAPGEWFFDSMMKAAVRTQDKMILTATQQAVDAFKAEKGSLPRSMEELEKAGYGPLQKPSGDVVLGLDRQTGQVGLYRLKK
ncbi:MAG TPA: hypothetical protein P5137_03370 [Candidatus Brocadiia bacterium]|nr:hypothetical protein [Candidatus Brocadiia bacterium]